MFGMIAVYIQSRYSNYFSIKKTALSNEKLFREYVTKYSESLCQTRKLNISNQIHRVRFVSDITSTPNTEMKDKSVP